MHLQTDMEIYEGHFYLRRIGLYLYKYRIYGTIGIYNIKRFIFCLSTDIKFISLALSSVKIYSFKYGIVKDIGQNLCEFNHAAIRKLDAVKFNSLW